MKDSEPSNQTTTATRVPVAGYLDASGNSVITHYMASDASRITPITDADSGRPDDKMIIGDGPCRVLMSHAGNGQIALHYTSGEGGWFDANEVAAVLGEFISRNL